MKRTSMSLHVLIAGTVGVLFLASVAWGTFTAAWRETSPTDNDQANQLGAFIRNFKRDIRERLAIDHNFVSYDATTSDTEGYHKAAHFLDQSADPDTVAAGGILYGKSGLPYWRTYGTGTVYDMITDSCVYDTVLSETCLTFAITGLNGDADNYYDIFIRKNIAALGGATFLYFNSDYSGTSYEYGRLWGMDATSTGVAWETGVAQPYVRISRALPLVLAGGPAHQTFRISVNAKTDATYGGRRTGFVEASCTKGLATLFSNRDGERTMFQWDNSNDNITSIGFSTGGTAILPGTRITVWRKRGTI